MFGPVPVEMFGIGPEAGVVVEVEWLLVEADEEATVGRRFRELPEGDLDEEVVAFRGGAASFRPGDVEIGEFAEPMGEFVEG